MMKGKKYEHLTTSHDEFVVVALSDLNGFDRFRDSILSLELYHIKSPSVYCFTKHNAYGGVGS